MTTKRRRTLENPSGLGKVSRNGEVIATVRYRLHVEQEMIVSQTPGGGEEMAGLQDISGEIEVMDGQGDLTGGDVLELRLEDGRLWLFFASAGNPVSAKYKAVNASGAGLETK